MRRWVIHFVLAAGLLTGCTGSTGVPVASPVQAEVAVPTPTSAASVIVESETTAAPEPSAAAPTSVPTATAPVATPTVVVEPVADCVQISGFATDGENALWTVVNDGVMGGLSRGGPTFVDSTMRFAGEINTNGGGFSSVRINLLPGSLDGSDHVVVRARTDGRTYKIIFDDALDGRDRRISHQADLVFGEADEDGWQTATASFDQLRASLFGRAVDVAPFRNDLAIEMGVMISDGIDGPFQIDIDQIDACR